MNGYFRALAGAACVAGFALGGCATMPPEDAERAAALEARIADLNAEAQALEDVAAIERLQRAYAFYIDKGYWDEAADLFTADATFETGVDGVYVGQDSIRRLIIAQGGGEPGPGLKYGQYNHHMHLQPVVHLAEDGLHATARWREIGMVGQFQENAFWEDGVFENAYVKEGGVWKIASVRYYPNFTAPYKGGWASLDAVADETSWVSDVAESLPADAPPTETYRPFPDVYVPPFHYEPSDIGVTGEGALPPTPAEPASGDELDTLEHLVAGDERALARLKSADAIANLQRAYGYYVDKGLWDDAAALFSEGATYEFGQGGVYVGRDHVRAALGLMGPEGLEAGQLNNYPMLQPIITVSDDNATAKARWRSDVQLAADGKGRVGSGVYENEYVNEDGVWRISKLHYYVTMWADYDEGWAVAPIPMDGPSRTTPPDQPPTEVYKSAPDGYLPAYDYVHPVTGQPHPGPGVREDWTADSAPTAPPMASHVDNAASGARRGLPASVNALGRRVTHLEDLAAVERVQRAYGYYVDKNQYYDMTDLFTDDAVYEIGGRGVFLGKQRVFEYASGLGPSMAPIRGRIFNHQQLQPIVTIDADGLTAHARLQAWVVAVAQWGDVTYENTYVKENGVWKIQRIFAPFNMYTDYDKGWGEHGRPANRPDSFGSPPDLAPTVVTLNYPNFYVAPFHYANPVTGREAPPPNPAAGGTADTADFVSGDDPRTLTRAQP